MLNLKSLIQDEIIRNHLSVKTIHLYFSMISIENEQQVSNEIQNVLSALSESEIQHVDIGEVARNIFLVLECLQAIESGKSLRDVSQLFESLLREQTQVQLLEDDRWRNIQKLLMQDHGTFSIAQLQHWWNSQRKDLPHLSETSLKWLKTITGHKKCIQLLYEKFADDGKFERHMQIFGTSDPIQQQRATALTNVRNLIIQFLKQDFHTLSHLNHQLSIMAAKISADDVTFLEVVVTSWNHLLVGVFDEAQYRFNQDKEMLDRLTAFAWKDENLISNLGKDGYLQYLQVTIDEAKVDDEHKQQTYSQSEFNAFTGRLLMYMTGDSGNSGSDSSSTPIHLMTNTDVLDLLRSCKQQLTKAIGAKRFMFAEELLRRRVVVGAQLVNAYQQVRASRSPKNIDLSPMTEVIFGSFFVNNPQQTVFDAEKTEQLTAEIIKVVDFQILRHRVQNDLIPKFDLCKKIGKYRLLYFSDGGRDKLLSNRKIRMSEPKLAFQDLHIQWEYYVIRGQNSRN